ncbi:MAG: hypothetical protein V7K57_00165 [Nostoc sp.]|uniref:hypothetical protein n=1 Tax=Nostoc sp. TaxID=1180 RepID=UPI002FF4506D
MMIAAIAYPTFFRGNFNCDFGLLFHVALHYGRWYAFRRANAMARLRQSHLPQG